MKYNILVIEEKDHRLRERIASALTMEGFGVATATCCEEAFPRLDKLRPELVILGNGLVVDCFEACYQLRQVFDALILMLGTVSDDEGRTKSVEAGADFYLVRPFSYVELTVRVKALIRRYELARSQNDRMDTDHVKI